MRRRQVSILAGDVIRVRYGRRAAMSPIMSLVEKCQLKACAGSFGTAQGAVAPHNPAPALAVARTAEHVAQHSFETAVTSGHRHHATVTDYLTAIADTTPTLTLTLTLTPDMI